MKTTELEPALKRTRDATLFMIAPLSSEELFTSPGPDRWSVAMVLDHLRMVDVGVTAMVDKLVAKALKTSIGPAPDEVDDPVDLPRMMRRINSRPVASTAIPAERPLDSIVVDFTAAGEALRQAANATLSVDCRERTFPHPYIGPMNAYTWLMFVAAHEAGHQEHIREIVGELGIADQSNPLV